MLKCAAEPLRDVPASTPYVVGIVSDHGNQTWLQEKGKRESKSDPPPQICCTAQETSIQKKGQPLSSPQVTPPSAKKGFTPLDLPMPIKLSCACFTIRMELQSADILRMRGSPPFLPLLPSS